MLVSNVLEKTPAEAAWQLCADKLADWVRTSYLDHLNAGVRQWEDTTHEDPAALIGLREEGFGHVVSPANVLKYSLKIMTAQRSGNIIILSSIAGRDGGMLQISTPPRQRPQALSRAARRWARPMVCV